MAAAARPDWCVSVAVQPGVLDEQQVKVEDGAEAPERGSPEASTDGAEAGWSGASVAAALASLYEDHDVKDELVLGPDCLQPQDIAMEQPVEQSDEAPQCCLKEEDGVEAPGSPEASTDGAEAGWSGASVAAALASLYEDHDVKDELVLGPECLNPQDVAMEQPVAPTRAEQQEPVQPGGEAESAGGRSTPVGNLGLTSTPELRTCFVKLKRIPHTKKLNTRRTRNKLVTPTRAEQQEPVQPGGEAEIAGGRSTPVGNLGLTNSPELRTCFVKLKRIPHTKKLNTRRTRNKLVTPTRAEQQEPVQPRGEAESAGGRSLPPGNLGLISGPEFRTCFVKLKRIPHTKKLNTRRTPQDLPSDKKKHKKEETNVKRLRSNRLLGKIAIQTEQQKPYLCSVCDKRFRLKGGLNKHLRVHRREEPFACESCKKQFTQKGSFMLHMRTHTGEKPFTCGSCKKQFTRRGNLILHMRLHGTSTFHLQNL